MVPCNSLFSSPLHFLLLSAPASQDLVFKVSERLPLGMTYAQYLFPPSSFSHTKAFARVVILEVARFINGIRAA